MESLAYYTARARQLSPGGMAKVAARRAYRTARQLLYRYGQGLGDAELLASFGAKSADDLARSCLAPRPTSWCDVSRRESTVRTLLELPSAVEAAWARAERAVNRRYRIFERELCFTYAMVDWHLDPVSGHRFPLDASTTLDPTPPGADPKYPWQLARLEALIALGQGYWLASVEPEKRRFAHEFVALTSEFIRANPPNTGIHWVCPMEVSLRAANIAQALYMFRDAPEVQDPAFLLATLRALAEHTAYVEANLEDKGLVPNNHLLADYVGLLVVASLFPNLPGAARQRDLAICGLAHQVPAQVFEDGVSFEGSTSYHRLVAELCVLATAFSRAQGLSIGAEVVQRTHGLLRASSLWCSEKGRAPQIGDNDSGRALALTDRESLDHGYLAQLGAVMFADASLKADADELCGEAAWLFGEEGLRTFNALPSQKATASFSSAAGGLTVLRGRGAVVTLSAGRTGQRGAGGHSHNDKLSFELHVRGEPTIVDPGSPVYARDPKLRNEYRSSHAHNAVIVDGLEQAPFDPARLFALPEGAHARVETFETSVSCDRVVAAHEGYRRLESPVTVRRTLELNKKLGALRVEEQLEGAGEHALTIFLQLPDAQVRLRGPRGEERQRAGRLLGGATLDDSLAIELGPKDQPRGVLLMDSGADVTLEASPYSTGYGEVHAAVRIAIRMRRTLPLTWRWAVLFAA